MAVSGFLARCLSVGIATLVSTSLVAQNVSPRTALPAQATPFGGTVNPRYEDSVAEWPRDVEAPSGAPNVLIWLLDDAGFAHIGAFGGLIDTPNIDRVAALGLRYNNFYATSLCSPSRAALLAGRNHHSVAMGSHATSAMGFPGYDGRVPRTAASFAKILKYSGYTTFALGKWDHTPPGEITVAGPFDRWPSGEGFDHFYGFMSADTDNFVPAMWADHVPISPYMGNPDYHLSSDMADKAIDWITGMRSTRRERPWAMLWATGAVHTPNHAPQAWLDKYRGRFDMGWDEARKRILARQIALGVVPKGTRLASRPPEVPEWSSLTAEERKLQAREMEAFAAQLAHADHEFGRMLDTLQRLGELDDTLIIITSDNGASGEGGPAGSYNEMRLVQGVGTTSAQNMPYLEEWGRGDGYYLFSAGWAVAGNTPFAYFKQSAHGGGTHVPMVLAWPRGMRARGELRQQFAHIIDLAPTVLSAAGIAPPSQVEGIPQKPLDGAALNSTFDDPAAKTRSVQYFEMMGNRGIYKDGWYAATLHANRMPWNLNVRAPFDSDTWQLFDLRSDFAGSRDLAKAQPQRLAELQRDWDTEARKYGVYPLYDDLGARLAAVFATSGPQGERFEFYPPGAYRISEPASPPVKLRNHTLSAILDIPAGGAEGVIVASGGRTGGYTLYVENGRLVYEYNYLDERYTRIVSDRALQPGRQEVSLRFQMTSATGGTGDLYFAGERVGTGSVESLMRGFFSTHETFDVGEDTGRPVSRQYAAPNAFTGTIERVVVEVPKN